MFKELNNITTKPPVWSRYTADILWTDDHIAKQMLAFHLNPEVSVASRTKSFIDKSVEWLVSEFTLNSASKVIDFGCGPGLYTERLKSKGIGTVVGVDFSPNSINYAKRQAEQNQLDIEYHLSNYLDFSDLRNFDLISLVMCDFCALSPEQRSRLLEKFKAMLDDDGVIALDVYTTSRFDKQSESLSLEKNAMNSFWSESDYWCIQSTFLYSDSLVTLDKYVLIEESKEWTVFNWLQHFNLEMLKGELEAHDLMIKKVYNNLCGEPFSKGDEMALTITHK